MNPKPKQNVKPKPKTHAITETVKQTPTHAECKAETEIRWELNSLDEKEDLELEKKYNTNEDINTYISSQLPTGAVAEGTYTNTYCSRTIYSNQSLLINLVILENRFNKNDVLNNL